MYRNPESYNPRYLYTPSLGPDLFQSGAGHDRLLGNIGNMRPVPSFMESGRAATNYKATDSVNPFDEVNGRVGEQDSPYQTDPGVISLHDPQPPFTASQSRNFTTLYPPTHLDRGLRGGTILVHPMPERMLRGSHLGRLDRRLRECSGMIRVSSTLQTRTQKIPDRSFRSHR
jgi:hypothetical protein